MSLTVPKLHLNLAVRPDSEGSLSFGPRTSCPVDLQRCHQLREMHAVMVGGSTYRVERPQLTAREEFLKRKPVGQTARIVVTRRGIPDLPPGVIEMLLPDGDLEKGLADLFRQGIRSIFVEGGPSLHRELLQRELFSSATVYIRGENPETALRALYRLLPGLPRNYRMRPLGEGYLLQFDFLQSVADPHVEAACWLPSESGFLRMHVFEDPARGLEHVALVLGDPAALCGSDQPPLVRLHSSCWTGDLFGSQRCDCGQQLRAALKAIQNEGSGVLLYLNQEGRGIGLRAKAMAYSLQEQGFDTYQANEMLHLPIEGRDYAFAAHMLKLLGVRKLRLLTNNPDKIHAVTDSGIEVTAQVTLGGAVNETNRPYLEAKVHQGHLHPILLT